MKAYRDWRGLGARGIALAILTAYAFLALVPLYWLFATSLIAQNAVLKFPPALFPNPPTLENYARLLKAGPIGRWLLNSSVVAATVTFFTVLFDSMAGYGFAKKRFPGRDQIFWTIIAMMIIPGQVTLVPIFIVMSRLGLLNTLYAVVLPALADVFGVFLMRQFILTIPSELEDAARIDGAGAFTIYSRIIVPLAAPALAVLAIFTFMGNWNNFLWPLIVLNDTNKLTLPVGLATLQQENTVDYGLQMAGAALAAVPMIALFLSLQRYFIKGLTLGGVKG
ncbi:carbohydrate ABC transporter permease [Carboxydochorda subterranea]|uniref:Carbohydrate ABC transporter permease n=1 Tax=Carboxydichorda subterranea TaxID=3109565 RepID=A0ABZ1BUU9_9FIRM|nr:carbohydrate ABC transporter permease [Limnochorda sp. L945t]WRP16265.1 carbohydrate ABC transporter permease [Limnochorda sp. L945t]